MTVISRLALAAILTATTATVVVPAVATAAERSDSKRAAIKLNDKESAAISAVDKAVAAKDGAAVAAAIAAAQPIVQSGQGRYVLGTRQVQFGLSLERGELQAPGTDPKALQMQGIEAMAASGAAPAEDLPVLYQNIANLAFDKKDYEKGDAALTKLIELRPNDGASRFTQAQLRVIQKRVPEGLQLLNQAITTQKASGQPVPEDWYTYGVAAADRAKLPAETVKLSEAWYQAYPNQKSWRALILSYRNTLAPAGQAIPDKALDIDTLRVLRMAKAMESENDYYRLSRALSDTGYPGEASAVLQEGVAANVVDRNKSPFTELISSTGGRVAADKSSLAASDAKARSAANGGPAQKIADAYLGYGDYAKAIDLYRVALQKGGVDANLVNTRLGMALAMAGQKADAEAALKAVTGPRAQLANYLQLWLARRG
jgi:tetratricopeptide (TPR) repeat protein